MRILLINQQFSPEPTLKGLDFTKALVARGHEVRVLTGFPNYPGGDLYPGYRVRLFQREEIDGVKIYRVPLYPSHDRSAIRRIATYVSFAISSAIAAPFVGKGVDVAYAYHAPGTIGLPALTLRLLRRVPFVYGLHDLWPDTLTSTGMVNSRLLLKMIGGWMKLIYRFAGRLNVISPGFKRRLVGRGVPADEIDIVYNWARHETPSTPRADRPWLQVLENRFNIVFAGNLGKAQALDSVLEAAALVAEQNDEIQFVFVGTGIEEEHLKQAAKTMDLPNVVFWPRVSVEEAEEFLAAADVLLVHLQDDPLFAITIPSKTQSYMAAGRPVLMGVAGDAADLIEQSQGGLRCDPEDPAGIADAALRLHSLPRAELEAMGKRARAFYDENLSFEAGVIRVEASLRKVAKG
jgi:glycosyltransferase involved in cell wall biosynthesis